MAFGVPFAAVPQSLWGRAGMEQNENRPSTHLSDNVEARPAEASSETSRLLGPIALLWVLVTFFYFLF